MAENQRRKSDWRAELGDLLSIHNAGRTDGKGGASYKTRETRRIVLNSCFSTLRELGYKFQSVRNFGSRHLEALMQHWIERELAPATIQNYLSVLRVFCEWIGKRGLVRNAENYVTDTTQVRRTYIATEDKSWTAAGVDVEATIKAIGEKDRYVAMQLKVIDAFGLRRKEAIMFKPMRAVSPDRTFLTIYEGTKGGRSRVMPLDTEYKRQVFEEAWVFASQNRGFLTNPSLTLAQAEARFKYVLSSFGFKRSVLGVTAHGLRHQYLNDRFEAIAGVPAPVRLNKENMPKAVDKTKIELARAVQTSEAGHGRLSITPAYAGNFNVYRKMGDLGEASEGGQAEASDASKSVTG